MNYQLIYDKLVAKYKGPTRLQAYRIHGYVETHHIVPKCLGGSDEDSNLVHFPARVHFIAHRLLVKIHPDSRDLWWAIHMMANTKRVDFKISSRVYETIKAEMARLGRDEDTKAKISKKLLGVPIGPHSDEHKQRISEGNRGKSRFRSPEHAESIAASNRGKKRTPEQIAKMAAGIKAAWTDERRARPKVPRPFKARGPISAEALANRLAYWTPENRAKISVPRGPRGPNSPESSKKMKEAWTPERRAKASLPRGSYKKRREKLLLLLETPKPEQDPS